MCANTTNVDRKSEVRSSPLTLSQHQLWLAEQIDPGSTAYHVADLYSLDGPLQTPVLEQAFNEIIRRHEALRTVFRIENDEAVQVVTSPFPLSLPIIDLSELTEDRRKHATDNQIRKEVERPFDLTTGPLLRPTLIRLSEHRHLLSLVTHHLISDGWSLGVLMRELEHFYAAFSRGARDPLPDLPIQYADFAAWQRERLSGEQLEHQLDYWRQRLAGVPAVHELPSDRPRPARRSARGARARLQLPDSLTARLREFSLREGGTLFMTLLSGFNILLSRYGDREDVVIGTPVAGRGRTDVEGLIGLFVNTLVLRTDLSGEPSFREVFRRVRAGFLHAFEHQEVPIEMLVDKLQVERSSSHTPLVQVLFNMLSYSDPRVKLSGLEIKRLSAPETDSKFDLTLYARDSPEGVVLAAAYSTDLFDETRMSELLGQFQRVLEQAVEDPNRKFTQYSLVTERARKVLPDPSRVLEGQWRGACHDLLAQQSRQTGDQPALVDTQGTWTYRELNECSNQLAHHLLAAGVQRGDTVAIYPHRSAPMVWAMLGILKAGAAFVILDPAYPEHRLLDYLQLVKPRGWLHVPAAGALPPALDNYLAQNSLLCRLELHSDSVAGYSTSAPAIAVRPGDLAYVAFTSGSSGQPKGVMGTHDSLAHYPFWLQETFSIGAADRFSMLSALSHDPLLRDIFTPLLLGAVLCIPDPELFGLPGALARWMNDERITVCNLTPAMGQLLCELPSEDESLELPTLRHSFFVGDLLTWRDVLQFRKLAPNTSCINLYGSTETQRALSYYIAPDKIDDKRKEVLPVGSGMTDVQLLVLNAKRHLAGIGETGEIYFRSPHLANGYWEDSTLTAERFVPNPFAEVTGERIYKTGDLGRYLPDGNLEILGRADRQVKIRGFRVEPAEIESALKANDGVRECVVLARDDTNGDEQLAAYVTSGLEASPTTGDLARALRQKLPAYMIPSAFVMLKELPLTPGGKVDRQALAKLEQSQPEVETNDVALQTPIEGMIGGILAHLLKADQVSLHDNFFDLGGHSLLAMQLIAKVNSTFQVTVPLRDLFETPTVAGLARCIESQLSSSAQAEATPIAHIAEEPEPPLSFSQESLLLREWWEDVNKLRKKPSRLASAYRLTGPLDVRLLEHVINEIVDRHDMLRATFPQTGGIFTWKGLYGAFRALYAVKGVQKHLMRLDHRGMHGSRAHGFTGGRKQIINHSQTVPLTVLDLRSASEAEISRVLRDEAAIPFDYDRGPLLRVVVLRLSSQEHILHFVLHHLIGDGWAMRVLIREVLTLYNARAEGKPSPLPELPIQYSDFARWQRESFCGETFQSRISYWKEQFSEVGLFPELSLPFMRAHQNGKNSQPAVEAQSLALSISLTRSLKTLGNARGVTTYMLFMAALSVLLHRYTGLPKISIYTPFANRGRVETHGLIGWVSNVLVLSFDCSGNPAFSQLLKNVREVVLGAYAHQEVPYLQLVKMLVRHDKHFQMPRRVSEAPYVRFDYLVQSQGAQQMGQLMLKSFSLPPASDTAGVSGLEVMALERGDEVVVNVKYSPNVMDAEHIDKMLSEFGRLLEGIACCPDERILNLPLT
jgi:amino acid adenylation domain-containing protein